MRSTRARQHARQLRRLPTARGLRSVEVTIADYAPGGVTGAAGCARGGSYTVCGSAGTTYAVSHFLINRDQCL